MPLKSYTGTPQFLQGNYAPTQNEAINIDQFNFGTITFFWDRFNENVWWLQSIDGEGLQTWKNYSADVDSLCTISILPILGNKLYWFVADYDPTSSENINSTLFNGTYGMLWNNELLGNLWLMTEYSDNGDGTYNQVWTQVA